MSSIIPSPSRGDQSNLPALPDYGADAGAGFENLSSSEIRIPFLNVLQDLSPEVTGSKGEPIPGAKAGLLMNSVTKELLGDFVRFVPAVREERYGVFTPRALGGGFHGSVRANDPLVRRAKPSGKFGELFLENGNELVHTFLLYGIVIGEAMLTPMVLAFNKTKIKVYTGWLNSALQVLVDSADGIRKPAPLFAHPVEIRTARETNKIGQSYFNLVLHPSKPADMVRNLLQPDDQRFLAARKLAAMFAEGQARADEKEADGGDLRTEDEF